MSPLAFFHMFVVVSVQTDVLFIVVVIVASDSLLVVVGIVHVHSVLVVLVCLGEWWSLCFWPYFVSALAADWFSWPLSFWVFLLKLSSERWNT